MEEKKQYTKREKRNKHCSEIIISVRTHSRNVTVYLLSPVPSSAAQSHTVSATLGIFSCLCLVFLIDFTELERTLMTVEGYLYTFLNNSQFDAFRIQQTTTLLFSSLPASTSEGIWRSLGHNSTTHVHAEAVFHFPFRL